VLPSRKGDGRVMAIAAMVIALVSTTTLPPRASADEVSPLTKLVDDVTQRLKTADPVAAAKYRSGGPVDDPTREREVINQVVATAVSRHVDEDFVRRVFRDQIDATDSLEHTRFAQWKIDPQSAPEAAPDLSSSRNVINALNTAIVDDIAEQWSTLHTVACRADLDRAIAAVAAQQHLDQVYLPALGYATHQYCG
jgi:chorismate mutase